jgi:hypothetical protein
MGFCGVQEELYPPPKVICTHTFPKSQSGLSSQKAPYGSPTHFPSTHVFFGLMQSIAVVQVSPGRFAISGIGISVQVELLALLYPTGQKGVRVLGC